MTFNLPTPVKKPRKQVIAEVMSDKNKPSPEYQAPNLMNALKKKRSAK